jgi:hypothetical protein
LLLHDLEAAQRD